jgi:flagellar basal-body rod protein FlgC
MSMFSIFNVSGSAVSAQAQRLNVVASNLANADAVAGPDGQAYKSNPTHPSADADGYVTQSNVNPVEEMVNMISASRSYQNNVEVMNTAKTLLLKTLQMGQ